MGVVQEKTTLLVNFVCAALLLLSNSPQHSGNRVTTQKLVKISSQNDWDGARDTIRKTFQIQRGSKSMCLVVEIPPNDQVRVYHLNREICKSQLADFSSGGFEYGETRKVGLVGTKIARGVFKIPHVTGNLCLMPYSLQAEIDEKGSWEKIQPKIIATPVREALELTPAPPFVSKYPASVKRPVVTCDEVQNPYMLHFEMKQRISNSEIEMWEHPFTTSGGELDSDFRKMGSIGQQITLKILSIEGVTEIFIKPHEVDVLIGEAHDWKLIKPQVIAIIQSEIMDAERNNPTIT